MDALDDCMNKTKCASIVNHTPAEIFNAKYKDLYKDVETSTWTDDDWEELNEEAEKIYNVSMKPLNRSREYFVLLDTFYEEFETENIQ